MSTGATTAKCFVITFNIFFWISGISLVSIGIWFKVDPDILEYINVSLTTDEAYIMTAANILIAFGAIVFTIAFCGCFGTLCNSRFLLGIYILFLIIIFLGELSVGIYAAIRKKHVLHSLDKVLTYSIKNDYIDNPESWDFIQEKTNIPPSCCTRNDDHEVIDQGKCQSEHNSGSYYYHDGCKDKLVIWIEDNSLIFIGMGVGIAMLQIIGLPIVISLFIMMGREQL